ncbi:hypothetical protein GCM10011401_15460 [Nesterenkonia cremea]|uniref:Uncharacterized protein n=1 Tax=Nesterenkonia cremea TaxID=1882340 RepID=A0A917AQX1_9MICC|nr:hypothetical protein GCM10011401_15460 [Nesterenkonia cremea]
MLEPHALLEGAGAWARQDASGDIADQDQTQGLGHFSAPESTRGKHTNLNEPQLGVSKRIDGSIRRMLFKSTPSSPDSAHQETKVTAARRPVVAQVSE